MAKQLSLFGSTIIPN